MKNDRLIQKKLKYFLFRNVMASSSKMPSKVTAETMETVYALLALARSDEQIGKNYHLRDRTQPTCKPVAPEPVVTKWLLRDRNQLKQPVRFY
jgi:hypothetical protein